jgi:hypothetical protein
VRTAGTTEQLLGVACREGEAFAVGMRGTIRRWNGEAWSEETSPTNEDLYAICAAKDDGTVVAVGGNLHIGGDSLILHREGTRWVAEPSGMQHILLTVTHSPSRGWFTAGYNGGILEGRPGSWNRVDVVHYSHVFAMHAGKTRVFAAGLGGTILEHDGEAWRPHEAEADAHLRALAGFVDDDVIAVGLSGTILRWNGRRWRSMASPTKAHLEAVWIASEKEAYAVGYAGTVLRFDGLTWQRLDVGDVRANLHGVSGHDEELIAVGGGGVALHLARA